jgi:NAD(P)-dependent dehydrogenase (short-subunit alcohol dehydrogenase family)/phosphopantetheinyl transferase
LSEWIDSRTAGAQAASSEPKTAATEQHPDAAALVSVPLDLEPDDFDIGILDTAEANRLPSSLPADFRLRRPALVARPALPKADQILASVRVIGESGLAVALRHALAKQGAASQRPHDVIIDASTDVMISFETAKELNKLPPHRWICVTQLGGLHPTVDVTTAHRNGARAGLAKALGREWARTSIKVVDVSPEWEDPTAAGHILAEILVADSAEIFLGPTGRHTLGYATMERPPEGGGSPNRSYLITGGGRGISARIALELALRAPVKLALVGRTPCGTKPLDELAERANIKTQLAEAGERVTPARINAELDRLRKAEEVRQTITGLEQQGAIVQYFTADLTSPQATASLVDDVIAAFGGIDVVIHGAGVEESRLLADKDSAAFHRVYDAKAIGGLALLRAIAPDAQFVSMGSIAGRFGNAGQVDYAAANDAMARACLARLGALHVDWTAWDNVGMAVRGGMRHRLASQGVSFLPADAGAALLADMLMAGTHGEVVVAGRLGGMFCSPSHVLVDTAELDGDQARTTRVLRSSEDRWLHDHAIDGVPVFAGVLGIEAMVAAAELLAPEDTWFGARDVVFEAPLKVHEHSPPTLVVEARRTSSGDMVCTVESERELRTGRMRSVEHFRGVLAYGSPPRSAPLPSAFLPDEPINSDQIYRRFFHGPAFQVLHEVLGVSEDGILATARADSSAITPGLVTEPLALEAAFQAAGLHRMLVANEMCLPHGVQSLTLRRRPDPGEDLTVTAQRDGGVYHVDVDGRHGAILRVRGLALIKRGPLPDGLRFPEPNSPRPICFPVMFESTLTDSALARADATDPVEPWLSPEEVAELRARGTDKRVRDRLAGRLAAKQALSELLEVPPHAIQVRTSGDGEPIVFAPDNPDVRVSISHRAGHAVAVAVRRGRIGVDLERVEKRPESFARTWFTPDERALIGGDPCRETVAWAAKEAVLKLIGKGMKLSPRDVIVEGIDEQSVWVALYGGVAARHAELGGSPITIGWTRVDQQEVFVQARAD